MRAIPTSGVELEARVQRLFIAQGVFAERHLYPSASPDHRMLATDIDVLVSEYVSGFQVTRRHAECKGGKTPLLDRILWLSGVKKLLGADGSYLITSDFDTEASDFARSLDIELLTIQQLTASEAAIPIPHDVWPCRSDYRCYDAARTAWTKLSRTEDRATNWQSLRQGLGFIEIDSWLTFRYRLLNRLLRLIGEIARGYEGTRSDQNRELCSRYLFSALLVRFCQYLLAVCQDVARLPLTDIGNYLCQRLTYGDQDPAHVSGLIKATVDWVKQELGKKGVTLPAETDLSKLYEPPQYIDAFIELTNRLFEQSYESRYLTIATETIQFGGSEIDSNFPKLKGAATAGDALAALVKGFVIRTFSVPKALAEPVARDMRAKYCSATDHAAKSRDHSGDQLSLQTP